MNTNKLNHHFITGFENTDMLLLTKNPELHLNLLNERKIRIDNAFNRVTKNAYLIKPLPTLEALQEKAAITIKEYYKKGNLLNYNKLVDDMVAEANRKIANQEYCMVGTEEWTYRENYFKAWEDFNNTWPDAEELAIREQEKELYKHLIDEDDLSD